VNLPAPYYDDGQVTIYCGRCEDVLPALEPADLIVTSPPYNMDVNLRQFCSAYEWIAVLAKPGFKLVNHAASGMSDMWRLGMEREDLGHPAPFPASLPKKALLATGARTVIDPFCGSGSTLRAALDLGRRAVGIELEERFCEIARRRLAQGVLDLAASGAR
jgi:site-specific DNA-methyltransferase (adenine-specific)